MDPAKTEFFRLKGEVLRLASEIVWQDGGTIGTYVVSRKKLDRESVAVQTRTCKLTPSP